MSVKIRLKGLTEEDFINYKLPSMFMATCFCDFKCEKEDLSGGTFCQNSPLAQAPIIEVGIKTLINKYINNPISKAVVIGGLEPFLQFEEVKDFITYFRIASKDPIIIYTGYTEEEIKEKVLLLIPFQNIIIKYGRYKINSKNRYDDILGVKLASDNQYARYYNGVETYNENTGKS